MFKVLSALIFIGVCTDGQVVNNVRIVDHREYMIKIITETIKEVEKREWCNLKLNDIQQSINETVVDNTHVSGTLTFRNGFVLAIQKLDILQSSLNQVWTSPNAFAASVEIRGQLRMNHVTLGFDIFANINNGGAYYTGVYTYPLIQFDFRVFKDLFTDEITVTVTPILPRTTSQFKYLPENKDTLVFAAMFDFNCTFDDINNWAHDIFQPIALDQIKTKVGLPRICYNCPIS